MRYLAGVMVLTAACGGGDKAADAGPPDIAFVESAVVPVTLSMDVQTIAAGDLDGDGAPDLYLRGPDQGLGGGHRAERAMLHNDGAGHLTSSPLADVGFSCSSVLIGDVTQDARADVTCLFGSDPGLDIETAVAYGPLADYKVTNQAPGAVAIVDAPAVRALVSANQTADLSALVASGAGSNAITTTVVATAAEPVNAVASGDVDGDGTPDMIACSSSDGYLAVFDGTTLARRDYPAAVPSCGLSVVQGLPHGGRSLVAMSGATVAVVPLVDGVPKPAATYELVGATRYFNGDLDGDGVPDLVFVGIADPSVQWMRGNPDGTLTPSRPIAVTGTMTGSFRAAAVVDLDRDGRSELVLVDSIAGSQPGSVTTTAHVFQIQVR